MSTTFVTVYDVFMVMPTVYPNFNTSFRSYLTKLQNTFLLYYLHLTILVNTIIDPCDNYREATISFFEKCCVMLHCMKASEYFSFVKTDKIESFRIQSDNVDAYEPSILATEPKLTATMR